MRRGAMSASMVLFVVAAAAPAEEWPGWRGPRGDGTSWKPTFRSAGARRRQRSVEGADPRQRPFVPHRLGRPHLCDHLPGEEQRRMLLCLDRRDGKVLWQRRSFRRQLEKKHKLNSFASSTPRHRRQARLGDLPAIPGHGGRLLRLRRQPGLAASRPGKFYSVHGFCSSPVLYKDMVIINGDQDAVAYIVALDKTTGAERWRADRPNRTRSYCTPHRDRRGRQEAAGPQRQQVRRQLRSGHRQAALDHRRPDRAVRRQPGLRRRRAVPDRRLPRVPPHGHPPRRRGQRHQDRTSRGTNRPVRPVPPTSLRRSRTGSTSTSCPIPASPAVSRRRPASICGPSVWAGITVPRRFLRATTSISRTTTVKTFVLKAGPEFALVNRNALEDECYASPAISRGQIFIRTLHDVYCIGQTPREEKQSRR